MYALDFNKLLQWQLPAALRQARLVTWLLALTKPLESLHGRFLATEAATRRDIRATGQVRNMTWWLNELFDPVLREIYIEELPMAATRYVYLESENQPQYLPFFLQGRFLDFRVHIPNDIANTEPLRAFVNRHKLAGKTYDVSVSIIRS